MVTVGELVDGADVPAGREQDVKDELVKLGYPAEETVGEAFLQLTEAQLLQGGLLSVREANAVLAKIQVPAGELVDNAGQQADVAFRPGDAIKVATVSGIVAMTVLKPLATALARGGAYRVLCQTGPWAGQQFVLKHGGRPGELAQLRLRGMSTASWHQVVRERELHLHLGSTHNGCIPEMKAYGRLAAPLPPGTSALEGADTVLLGPIGEELRALPLSTHEVLCAAADILGAIIHLIERGAFHNEVHPRHVLLQPLPQEGRRCFMLIDFGGSACPRLAHPAIEAQLCEPNQDVAPMLDMRPCIVDLLCGSLQSLRGSSGRLLSQGSDLQSLVFTVVLLAGGHLPWEAAAEAGDVAVACELRMQLIAGSGNAGILQCLPPPLRQFAAWVLRTAGSQTVNIEEVRSWHRALLEAVGSATARQELPMQTDFGVAKQVAYEYRSCDRVEAF